MAGYYPINIDIGQTNCLVVGGGKVAERKVVTLLTYGAKVTVVSPQITSCLNELVQQGKICYMNRGYEKGDCEGMWVVIVATGSDKVNQQAAQEAMGLHCLVNVVDQPCLSNFIVPATIKRGDLQISVSTNGQSPALARRIRESLEKEFGPEYEYFLKIMGEVREKASLKIPDPGKRRNLFFRIVDSDIIRLLREGKEEKARQRLEELFESSMF